MLLVKTEMRTMMDVAGGNGEKQRLDMAASFEETAENGGLSSVLLLLLLTTSWKNIWLL